MSIQKSTIQLKDDYRPGERPSAAEINTVNRLLRKLVSLAPGLLEWRHRTGADGLEINLNPAGITAAGLPDILAATEFAPALDFQVSGGYLQARVKTVTLAIDGDGLLALAAGETWGGWTNINAVSTCSEA